MQTVAVITGGAGGMGLATAKRLGKTHQLLLSDVNAERLHAAVTELQQQGMTAQAMVCDITDRAAVDALARCAQNMGTVTAVAHTAGISPQMAGPEAILRVNALGTICITEAFHALAGDGFALVNLSLIHI